MVRLGWLASVLVRDVDGEAAPLPRRLSLEDLCREIISLLLAIFSIEHCLTKISAPGSWRHSFSGVRHAVGPQPRRVKAPEQHATTLHYEY